MNGDGPATAAPPAAAPPATAPPAAAPLAAGEVPGYPVVGELLPARSDGTTLEIR